MGEKGEKWSRTKAYPQQKKKENVVWKTLDQKLGNGERGKEKHA
jgi:hypothetical protein